MWEQVGKREKCVMVRVKRRAALRGRPRGTRDEVPRNVRASVKAVIEEVVSEQQPSIYEAITDGLNSGARYAHNYLRLCAEYTDGKPDATLNLRTQFRETEIEQAERSLTRKFEQMFQRVANSTVLLPRTSDDALST